MIDITRKFFITTAIPYVNADPHIGHVLEFIQTDAICRYKKLSGHDVFLATGADENSIKNVQAAERLGISTQRLCDINAEKFRQMADKILLSYDVFLRSSSQRDHWPGVNRLWELCKHDIYRKKYHGLYCNGCEAFYTESELVDGVCPEHGVKPEVVEEENYFFRLSKYQNQLERLIERNELKIIPETRKNEVLSFIRSGLEDFSVSRSAERARGWGVPVPGDPKQIMYVWFDALNVYQTAVGYGRDDALYAKWWPADLHVIGKGITRFHAVYWPAILLSAGLQVPKAVFVHGYITVGGQKMSKSLGNVVDPNEIIRKYGADALRYFMLTLTPFEDGDFSERALAERANSELVDNYCNLFYRITYFIEKNFGGRVPEGSAGKEKRIEEKSREKIKNYIDMFSDYRIREALMEAMELSGELNKYFQDKKPWENPQKSGETLYTAVNILHDITSMLVPFVPAMAETALAALNAKPSLSAGFALKPGHPIKATMLKKRIENMPKDNRAAKKKPKGDRLAGTLPFGEFKKIDMRVATITRVDDHPNADKLYVLTVDLGEEQRSIVAGLKEKYNKEDLLGKQVIVITNLEEKDFRGKRSDGMLLAAEDGTLIAPIRKVPNGFRIM